MEYQIIRAESYTMLEQQVCNALKQGWLPLGGVAMAWTNSDVMIAQAMTRATGQ